MRAGVKIGRKQALDDSLRQKKKWGDQYYRIIMIIMRYMQI